ncbi:hypothetical protein V7S43_015796 [Phytophthora oleae]|uniref:Uncharacterized protein n=1 Tax=Phytophthora oleae TaxID=2107226 RepID=A0ABD3EXE1_9STRA
MFAQFALSTVAACVALISSVNAHGYLEEPSPSWVDSPNSGWIANIDNYWDIGSGGDQCGLFKTMAEEKGVRVKDVVRIWSAVATSAATLWLMALVKLFRRTEGQVAG